MTRALLLGLALLSAGCAATQNNSPVGTPDSDKPFDGEWRTCYGNQCDSYFWIQEGNRICGTWKVGDDYGLLQAEWIPHGTFAPYVDEINFEDFARVKYICGPNTHNGLSNMACGAPDNSAMNALTWQESDWTLRTCKQRRAVGIAEPWAGLDSICPTKPPLEMNTYRPMSEADRGRLMSMPWVRQCLAGETPTNIKKPRY